MTWVLAAAAASLVGSCCFSLFQGQLAATRAQTSLQRPVLQPRRLPHVAQQAFPADLWFPPLETLPDSRPSGKGFLASCFPLPLQRGAVPGGSRTLNVREPRYLRMYSDLLLAGSRTIILPRCTTVYNPGGEVSTRLAKAAVGLLLKEVKDAPPGSRHRLVCEHEVASRPVRLLNLLNPAAFLSGADFLKAECEEIVDTDSEVDCTAEERKLLNALYEVAALKDRLGDPLRRWEHGVDAEGRPWLVDYWELPTITEETVAMADPSRTGFWDLVKVWQGYCERRLVAQRQHRERAQASAEGADQLSATEAAELRRLSQQDSEALIESSSELLMRLLQADAHQQRLALLRSVAEEEAACLAAVLAVKRAVGGGPPP